MGGADALAVGDQEARVERHVDRRDRLELVRGQVGAERDRQQQPAGTARRLTHARAEQVLDRGRNREVLAHAARRQQPPDLQREQRVAERGVDDPAQDGGRHLEAEPLDQQAARGPHVQRPDVHALQRPSFQRPLEHRRLAGPPGEQEPDRHVVQTPRREGQCLS